jgi:hypothetical protein
MISYDAVARASKQFLFAGRRTGDVRQRNGYRGRRAAVGLPQHGFGTGGGQSEGAILLLVLGSNSGHAGGERQTMGLPTSKRVRLAMRRQSARARR